MLDPVPLEGLLTGSQNLPNDHVTLKEELARMKAERLAKKAEREARANSPAS